MIPVTKQDLRDLAGGAMTEKELDGAYKQLVEAVQILDELVAMVRTMSPNDLEHLNALDYNGYNVVDRELLDELIAKAIKRP